MSRPILYVSLGVCVAYALVTAAAVVVPLTIALLIVVALPVLVFRRMARQLGGRR